jgi:hypothetical protein
MSMAVIAGRKIAKLKMGNLRPRAPSSGDGPSGAADNGTHHYCRSFAWLTSCEASFMMRTFLSIIGALLVIGTVNCADRDPHGGTPDGGGGTHESGIPDGVSRHDADGGGCCPIDPTPGCCMNYGGARHSGICATVCDGMAWPNDPRWEKRTDENGCAYWVDPPYDPARGVCGGVRSEAGVDAPKDTPPNPDTPIGVDVHDDSDGGLCCPIDATPG